MNESQQTYSKPDERIDHLTTSQSYPRTTGTSTSLVTEENQPTSVSQSNASSVSTGIKGVNPTLSRLLVSGLVGATLGTLAGALTGKKASDGFNHAAKGVGQALKTIGGGLNQTAKGVGDAVKSVGEGVGQAVVGTTSDVVTGTTESLKPVVQGALDAVKDTADNVKQSAVGAANAVKDTADNAKQSAVGAADAVKDTAEDAKQSVTDTNQVTTGQSSTVQYAEPKTTAITSSLAKERQIIDQSLDVDPSAVDFTEGQTTDLGISTETSDSEYNYGA